MNNNIKTALIIGGIVVVILIIFPLLGGLFSGWWGGGGWGMKGPGMMGPGMMGGFGGGPLFMVLFWGLIIWGVVALIRGIDSSGGGTYSGRTDSALELLKRRYARGDVSKEEYEEKRKDLL